MQQKKRKHVVFVEHIEIFELSAFLPVSFSGLPIEGTLACLSATTVESNLDFFDTKLVLLDELQSYTVQQCKI